MTLQPLLHLISRKQAKAMGMARYFTGKPCKYNQYGARRTSNGCCACFICDALRKVNVIEWRRNNHELHRHNERMSAQRRRLAPCNPVFVSK